MIIQKKKKRKKQKEMYSFELFLFSRWDQFDAKHIVKHTKTKKKEANG